MNTDLRTFSTSLQKDVNAAALVLEPECAPFAFLYRKAISTPKSSSK